MITETQRQLRRKYLGSSDSPVIMNLSPYSRTPTDIYWSKMTDLPDESTAAMDTGNWLEGPLLEWAAGELGVQIYTDPEILFHVAQQGNGQGLFSANLDALISDSDEAIEAKFRNADASKQWGDPGTDQVPYDVIVQCQHQAYAADLDKVYVALATPSYYGVDRKLYIVPRDEVIIEEIVKFGREWWYQHIEAKSPPDGEAVPPLYVLKALDRKFDAQIRLPEEAVGWADARNELKSQIKSLALDIEEIDRKLIHALGEAEIGLLTDGRKVTYRQYQSNRFDSKQFKLDHPELARDYMKQSSYRTLYIKKK